MGENPQRHTPGGPSSDDPSPWALAGLGMQFVVALLVFVYAGNWVDAHFGTAPVGLLVGVFVGGGGTFVLGVRQLTRRGGPPGGASGPGNS